MGTANLDIYELLKENLLTRDDAIIGEAAGLAMGLVMIGTASPVALEDMINVRVREEEEEVEEEEVEEVGGGGGGGGGEGR